MTVEERIAFAAAKNEEFLNQEPQKVLEYFLNEFPETSALSSSLSYEDQTITDMMVGIRKDARIFTLDTGRQFPETYDLIDRTNMQYGIRIEVFFPDWHNVQKMVKEHGINLFYDSVEFRHLCCNVRKVEPLKRALQGVEVWISGLRREQSVTRANMQMVEYDTADNVIKLNPLILWTEEQVKEYVRKTACRSTNCTMRASRASDASLVRELSNPVRTSAPDVGGGRTRTIASAVSTAGNRSLS